MYSIRFPLVIVKTRIGRHIYRALEADKTGLHGARLCAAGMITSAIHYRDRAAIIISQAELSDRIAKLGMRHSALWARVFAGQISGDDPRLDSVMEERRRLMKELHERSMNRATA